MLRSTTRISHSKTVVQLEEPTAPPIQPKLVRDPGKWVMIPAFARKRHPLVEKRMEALAEFSETFPGNRVEGVDSKVGIITSGTSYQYAKEAMPQASFLKLGMVYPLPQQMIRSFASRVEKLYVIEELDPFIEDQIRALGIAVIGKKVFPICGEFNPTIVRHGLTDAAPLTSQEPTQPLPARPPIMCPGCPHRGIFHILGKLKLFVTGEIGCYTLGALPPLSSIDTCVCMGAAIGHAMGLDRGLEEEARGKVVAVIGDSTFLHSGITPLLNAVYNRGAITVIILDNRTTAMTGRQEHPGTGFTLRGEQTVQTDLGRLAKALGVKHVKRVNPYRLAETERVIKRALKRAEVSVMIAQAPCVLSPRERILPGKAWSLHESRCTGCRACLRLGCPAIAWVPEAPQGEQKKRTGRPRIDPFLCNGCSLCAQVCKFKAIME